MEKSTNIFEKQNERLKIENTTKAYKKNQSLNLKLYFLLYIRYSL